MSFFSRSKNAQVATDSSKIAESKKLVPEDTGTQAITTPKQEQRTASSDVNSASATRIVIALHELATAAGELMAKWPFSTPVNAGAVDESRLTRALLLSGNGARLEQCVLTAIRAYRIAHENVRHYEQSDLEESVRLDILARFRQQLDLAKQQLRLLGTQMTVPLIGDKLNESRHRVVRVTACERAGHAETIADVISQGFEWLDEQGAIQSDPAHVVVYSPMRSAWEPSVSSWADPNAGARKPVNASEGDSPIDSGPPSTKRTGSRAGNASTSRSYRRQE